MRSDFFERIPDMPDMNNKILIKKLTNRSLLVFMHSTRRYLIKRKQTFFTY